jgi:hypothetical protein
VCASWWLAAVTSSCVLYFNPSMSLIGDCFALPFGAGCAMRLVLSCRENFPHCGFILNVLLRFSVRCHRITDEGWNYPKSRSGSLTGQRAKFVAILFLALAARFKIVINICHLMSYYFLELLPIFVTLNTPVLFPHLIQQLI